MDVDDPTFVGLPKPHNRIARNSLKGFASGWMTTLASAGVVGASDPKLPANCSALTETDPNCSIERVVLDTARAAIVKQFPAIEVGVAVGQRLVCAVLRPDARAKWCGSGTSA